MEYMEGLQFNKGYISPYFATDTKQGLAQYSNPYILILFDKLKDVKDIMLHLEYARMNRRPIAIVV